MSPVDGRIGDKKNMRLSEVESARSENQVQEHKTFDWLSPLGHWIHQVQRLDGSLLKLLNIRAFKFEQIWKPNPSSHSVVRFQSSGTSDLLGGRKATVELDLDGLSHYAKAATKGYKEFLRSVGFGENAILVSLVPSTKHWPQSSLAHMIALIARSGHPVTWATPEGLFAVLESLQSSAPSSEVIIFGTSLHHHMVSEQHFCTSPNSLKSLLDLSLIVVDTGGSKGTTIVLDSLQMASMLKRTYGSMLKRAPLVCSEYGMCELLSQAWSLPGELRTFRCSETLEALTIDPNSLRELPKGQIGFLAFIDRASPQHTLALLTEDLGLIEESEGPVQFKLLGRSPTSSLKGCSLRVTGWIANGKFSENRPQTIPPGQITSTQPCSFRELKAAKTLWKYDEHEKLSLQRAWESWTPAHRTLNSPARRLLIICSANTPITPLFPIFSAWDNGFQEVVIKMPSNRDDDPLSVLIREQIDQLISCLRESLTNTGFLINVHNGELNPSLVASFDDVIVFGTDSTVAHLKSLCPAEVRFHGFGEIVNSHPWSKDQTPAELAKICMTWKGRGCLTPRALVCSGPELPTQKDLHELLVHLDNEALEAYGQVEDQRQFYHWHNMQHLRALMLRNGFPETTVKSRILHAEMAVVIDLTGLPAELIGEWVPIDFGGQGFVFIMDMDQTAQLETIQKVRIRSIDPNPQYLDPHDGRDWRNLLKYAIGPTSQENPVSHEQNTLGHDANF